jgi:hypothetical protein
VNARWPVCLHGLYFGLTVPVASARLWFFLGQRCPQLPRPQCSCPGPGLGWKAVSSSPLLPLRFQHALITESYEDRINCEARRILFACRSVYCSAILSVFT